MVVGDCFEIILSRKWCCGSGLGIYVNLEPSSAYSDAVRMLKPPSGLIEKLNEEGIRYL